MQTMNMKKEFAKILKIKHLDEYHDLYVQSDILLLSDVLDNFWNMYRKIYNPDPERIF